MKQSISSLAQLKFLKKLSNFGSLGFSRDTLPLRVRIGVGVWRLCLSENIDRYVVIYQISRKKNDP